MTRPPAPHPTDHAPECSTSDMVPSLDALAAIADVASGAYSGYENGVKYGVASLIVGGIYAAGAIYGAHNVRACRRETERSAAAEVADTARAMRAGGCGPVVETALRLAQESPEKYGPFIHDPKFASCF
jgi:hypothetical protein